MQELLLNCTDEKGLNAAHSSTFAFALAFAASSFSFGLLPRHHNHSCLLYICKVSVLLTDESWTVLLPLKRAKRHGVNGPCMIEISISRPRKKRRNRPQRAVRTPLFSLDTGVSPKTACLFLVSFPFCHFRQKSFSIDKYYHSAS